MPAFFLLFAPVALPVAASPQATPPDVATIRERVRTAAGLLPAESRQTTVTVSSNATTSTVRRFQRGASWRETNDTPPFHSERGNENGQAWHQNDNGQTVLDQPDPGAATGEPAVATVTHGQKPSDAYVIATLNARGYGVKEFIDPAAWYVVRREVIAPNGTATTTYDDVRADHGRTFAHHWHVDGGTSGISSDVKITEYDTAPVAAANVEIVHSRRQLVEFPNGVTSVDLPATFGPQHVYVRVTINGRGLDYVLDTGASGITIDMQVAKELGLPLHAQRSTVTAQRYTTARTRVPEMRIGNLILHDVAVQAIPQGNDETGSVKVVGLLGFDFLAELGVTIDYQHKRVTVVPGEAYVPPAAPHTTSLDVRIGSGVPMTDVAINGALAERFILDTGGVGTFLIFDYFARRHPEALKDEGEGARSRPKRFHGIGGSFDTRPYQIAALKLGNIRFTDFVGYRVTSAGSYAGASDGIIGDVFLRMFTLGLDYGNSRVYLVPNDVGRKAMGIRE
ncbi:MAG: aspartyl protease family protein [Candidatus Eremiobacteraeota bacterium]|nr:aspartyl protease family protein [Candidatus Eremiobacteraeota bacterium]